MLASLSDVHVWSPIGSVLFMFVGAAVFIFAPRDDRSEDAQGPSL